MSVTSSVPFSELIRRPTETAGRLAQVRSVRLSRRDAEDLLLMNADRADAEIQAMDTTGRLLSLLANLHPELITELLPSALPWVRFLPDSALERFSVEFIATAEAAGAVKNLAPLARVLVDWRSTAEVYADPELLHAATRSDLDDYGPVPRPTP